jgi:choline dehydrogenase
MPAHTAEYDHILVGAGSAGCVLANRLSADPARRVLLLEAGPPDRNPDIRVPLAWSRLLKSEVDWDCATVAEEALAGRSIYWPRGKTLGGSSSINAMVYLRGHREDFDEWARLGNPGWSSADVLRLFRKSEHNERGADNYHGTGGPLNVADLRSPHLLTTAFLSACFEAGLPCNPDFNGPEQDGAGLVQVTQKAGRRYSCADAFLRPALGRPNLAVHTGAHATRILFTGRRAVGVAYQAGGRPVTARAQREVVLCGGAVHSPHLLLLSGIGPAEHLRTHGIPLVHDLAGVGQNLQDHLLVLVLYQARGVRSLVSAGSLPNLVRYLLWKRGPLTSPVMEAAGFVRTRKGLAAPDLEVGFGPVLFLDEGLTAPTEHGFSLGGVLLRPRSTGQVCLRSADPLAPPHIEPRYLCDESGEDLRTLVEGVRLLRRIAGAPALERFRGGEIAPGVACRTDEDVERFIRTRAQTIYHPVGTCKMGVDDLAVVDPRLRVRGLEGLRVADASVMPTNVRGHTNAAAIMVGEKAAELILQDG